MMREHTENTSGSCNGRASNDEIDSCSTGLAVLVGHAGSQ